MQIKPISGGGQGKPLSPTELKEFCNQEIAKGKRKIANLEKKLAEGGDKESVEAMLTSTKKLVSFYQDLSTSKDVMKGVAKDQFNKFLAQGRAELGDKEFTDLVALLGNIGKK